MKKVILIIEEKITDEQLLAGEKIEIEYRNFFNNSNYKKVFPDEFPPEQQLLFKQVYEDAVFRSEVGNKVYKSSNIERLVTISGFTRIEPTELGVIPFDSSEVITLLFTRYGFKNQSRKITCNFSEALTADHLASLLEIGIEITGTSNQFEIISYDGDISIEVVKEVSDSYIDLGDFKEGTLTLQK